jgi:hypothetical protein
MLYMFPRVSIVNGQIPCEIECCSGNMDWLCLKSCIIQVLKFISELSKLFSARSVRLLRHQAANIQLETFQAQLLRDIVFDNNSGNGWIRSISYDIDIRFIREEFMTLSW